MYFVLVGRCAWARSRAQWGRGGRRRPSQGILELLATGRRRPNEAARRYWRRRVETEVHGLTRLPHGGNVGDGGIEAKSHVGFPDYVQIVGCDPPSLRAPLLGDGEHTKDLDEADAFAEALSRCLVRHARILLRYGKITRKCRRRHGGFGTFLHNPQS